MNVKKIATVALVCGSLASLGGCAMLSRKGDSSAMSGNPTNFVVDSTHMDKTDNQANAEGVKVVWINSPEKSVTSN
jgi:hypothetical protein